MSSLPPSVAQISRLADATLINEKLEVLLVSISKDNTGT
jgi:hypothetical protein